MQLALIVLLPFVGALLPPLLIRAGRNTCATATFLVLTIAGERLELSRFLRPDVIEDHRDAPVNALGYLRVMFAVEDLSDTLDRLVPHGGKLVGEVVNYQDVYRLCYIRGPEGILIGLAQELF